MNAKFGSYGEINNGWSAEEAKGFIKINGNQNKIHQQVNSRSMIQAGIIGGAGYTAGELIRLLLIHSKTEINFVYSTSSAGKKLSCDSSRFGRVYRPTVYRYNQYRGGCFIPVFRAWKFKIIFRKELLFKRHKNH